MNREIKFRIWDKKNKQLGKTFSLNTDIIIQFTGLLDKNGKEIYEGDIVSVNEKGFEDKTNYEVKWFGPYYPAFDLEGWEGESNALGEIEQTGEWDIEVIGNIYENPELLNN